MSVDILILCVLIQAPDEVSIPCAEFAGLLLDSLRPSSVSCNTKLANLCYGKNVLKQIISQHRTRIDLSSSITHQICNGHDFLVPETIPDCKQHCRAAQKEI